MTLAPLQPTQPEVHQPWQQQIQKLQPATSLKQLIGVLNQCLGNFTTDLLMTLHIAAPCCHLPQYQVVRPNCICYINACMCLWVLYLTLPLHSYSYVYMALDYKQHHWYVRLSLLKYNFQMAQIMKWLPAIWDYMKKVKLSISMVPPTHTQSLYHWLAIKRPKRQRWDSLYSFSCACPKAHMHVSLLFND